MKLWLIFFILVFSSFHDVAQHTQFHSLGEVTSTGFHVDADKSVDIFPMKKQTGFDNKNDVKIKRDIGYLNTQEEEQVEPYRKEHDSYDQEIPYRKIDDQKRRQYYGKDIFLYWVKRPFQHIAGHI